LKRKENKAITLFSRLRLTSPSAGNTGCRHVHHQVKGGRERGGHTTA